MTEVDLLNDILTSNPNESAAKGAVLLLRTEMKSEFKAISQKLDRHDERFSSIDSSLDLIARQIAILVESGQGRT